MEIEIFEEDPEVLPDYEKISIAFQVESYFRIGLLENGLGGINLIEEKADPFIKDYDENSTERPSNWIKRFDISNWGILSAFNGRQRVGGAVIAWKTPEIQMIEGRNDLACLWDLRVAPDYRGAGIGNKLFARALDWARERNCRQLNVETQNINVPACRFYVRQGCELGKINRFAYPEFVNETQLIWYRKI